MKKLCSITLIVHNRLSYTKMTLESLFKNTYYPYELIVVENKSNKETRDYLLSKQDQIDHLILNKKNLGKVNANNIGWRISRGDYIATVENDILLTDHWLTKCIEYLEAVPKIGIISPTNHDLDRYERGKTKQYEVIKETINGKTVLIPKIGVIPGTTVARREVIEKIGLHRTNGCLYEHSCPNFSRRMQKAGFLTVYPSDFNCYHVDSKNKSFEWISKQYNLDKEQYDNYKENNTKIKNVKIDESLIFNFLNFK